MAIENYNFITQIKNTILMYLQNWKPTAVPTKLSPTIGQGA